MNTFQRLRTFSTVFLLLFGTAFLAACESEEPNVEPTVEDIAEAGDDEVFDDDGFYGAQEVYEGYNEYLGQTVTVSGEIEEFYGSNAFTIGEDLWGESLMVVVPEGTTYGGTAVTGASIATFDDLDREYVIQVTGTVRQYVEAEIESDYGWGWDWESEIGVELEEQEPMIVAESVNVYPEEATEDLDEGL